MCGESDLCMHCDIDEMTRRIANSNHATKTRLDVESAPVIPVEPFEARVGPISPSIQNLLDETESSQLSMVDDCRSSY